MFKLEFVYCTGREAHVLDFLSHIATVVVEPGWLEQVARAQLAAPELLTFLEAACGQHPAFVLHGWGSFLVLYRVSADHDQLILPAAGGFRELLLAGLHDSRLGSHLDSHHMLVALELRVWWPGMNADMAAYVSSCPTCQHVKDTTQKQQGLLQTLAHQRSISPATPWTSSLACPMLRARMGCGAMG